MKDFIENNNVSLNGEIVGGFTFSHEVYGEKFYLVDVRVKRLSDSYDIIPVMVSDRLLDINQNYEGCLVRICGQFRSFNRHEEEKNKLVLSVFAREIESLESIVVSPEANQIELEGYICKEPIYRETPRGREITDILVAVNRPYGKSDYIPCICWGRNARFAANFQVGEKIKVVGRIQSRTYHKKLDEEHSEERIAYEVSINKLEVLEDEE